MGLPYLPMRALFALFLLALVCLPTSSYGQRVVDEIVAVVGNRLVLHSDVEAYALQSMQRPGPVTDDLWRLSLRQMVDLRVMAVVAEADTNIRVTDDQVAQSIQQRISQMVQQVGSEQRLEELYSTTVPELRQRLRREFRDQLLANEIRGQRFRGMRVTPSEVRQWFETIPQDSLPMLPETVRLLHIVRNPVPDAASDRFAREVISTIRDSIVSGRSPFERMATNFSEDTGSAREGGRIANIRLSDLVPEFAAVASRLPIGEISMPFKTIFGYHIMRVNERRGDVVDFNHVLIRIDASSADPAPAIEYLNMVRDSILNQGMPLELMARRHSEDAFSSQLGGRVVDPRSRDRDLSLEALGVRWQTTIAGLQPGQISEPSPVDLFDGRRAYHIVMLVRRVPAHRVNLQDDYEQLEQFALQAKQNREMETWLNQLRTRVYIEYRGRGLEVMRNS